jgi:hypothetical protein
MAQDDSKLPDGNGKVPKLNGVVGCSILGCEIVFLLDIILSRWSNASYVPNIMKYYIEVGINI